MISPKYRIKYCLKQLLKCLYLTISIKTSMLYCEVEKKTSSDLYNKIQSKYKKYTYIKSTHICLYSHRNYLDSKKLFLKNQMEPIFPLHTFFIYIYISTPRCITFTHTYTHKYTQSLKTKGLNKDLNYSALFYGN